MKESDRNVTCCIILLCSIFRIDQTIKTESRLEITKGWVGREMRSDYLIGCFSEVMESFKIDNVANILYAAELYNLKWLAVCFMLFNKFYIGT